MQVVYPCCCGLDVHKKSVTACVLWAEDGGKSRKEKRSFGTFTRDLLRLADWLQQCGVTHVALESPECIGSRCGTFWRECLHPSRLAKDFHRSICGLDSVDGLYFFNYQIA